MTNIKRRIASFVAAFAMVGVVGVPTVAEKLSADNAITASAAYIEGKVDFWVDVKANTVFRQSSSTNSPVVASVGSRTYNKTVHLTRVAATRSGIWYYSQYDKGWVHSNRIIW